MRLQDKKILITGGASGIGLASVERCLEEGASVVMSDLATSKGEALAKELDAKHSGRCLFIPADVSSTTEVDALLNKMQQELGRVDGVFNNAGIGGLAPSTEVTDEDFDKILQINLTGVFRVARAALKIMEKQDSGSIVNCASILGVFGQSQTAAYTAAKGGVVNMTRTLALEYASKGIRVNAIGPGYIDTPLLEALDDELKQFLIGMHPLGRLGRSEEVANAFLFLVSDEASFVTGAHLMVDGGFTAGKS
ncbi:NAD(P)-dependent dehydrogenase, short-chain alcohol dehydrogenase family [Marinospirillum celere]|uniref:NAD(P)-dependent dehydrogenase, short-chain alcohol dehydrogenase family n=1 Tax=Marinospirillum celere TaxID=1122252 RepID=A0A1I1JH47_9GAMM|nr:SDR family NAD(P)-dependent oxidoreductase [Marinospirillum celere]SFC45273.1 NAD(P)-dependent dehydrogenase, short-chain alcohol dehydrogenase family [Marinospirillum celere]